MINKIEESKVKLRKLRALNMIAFHPKQFIKLSKQNEEINNIFDSLLIKEVTK